MELESDNDGCSSAGLGRLKHLYTVSTLSDPVHLVTRLSYYITLKCALRRYMYYYINAVRVLIMSGYRIVKRTSNFSYYYLIE